MFHCIELVRFALERSSWFVPRPSGGRARQLIKLQFPRPRHSGPSARGEPAKRGLVMDVTKKVAPPNLEPPEVPPSRGSACALRGVDD